jgi:hypothetical protein
MATIFTRDADIEIISNASIVPLVVSCKSFVHSKMTEGIKYLHHPIFGGEQKTRGDPWPQSTEIACLHDGHIFYTTPIPIVRRYDSNRGVYYVHGVFCSANCAKAYIIEHEPNITTQRMIDFNRMLRECFEIKGLIKPAPPRTRIKLFGGPLSISQFRRMFRHLVIEEEIYPPFVPSDELIVQIRDIAANKPERHNVTVNTAHDKNRASCSGGPSKSKVHEKQQPPAVLFAQHPQPLATIPAHSEFTQFDNQMVGGLFEQYVQNDSDTIPPEIMSVVTKKKKKKPTLKVRQRIEQLKRQCPTFEEEKHEKTVVKTMDNIAMPEIQPPVQHSPLIAEDVAIAIVKMVVNQDVAITNLKVAVHEKNIDEPQGMEIDTIPKKKSSKKKTSKKKKSTINTGSLNNFLVFHSKET